MDVYFSFSFLIFGVLEGVAGLSEAVFEGISCLSFCD